ncbi:MAG: mechanosensitive ion channel [Alphaproteobacteria bacterium]|nr:mechanosensitive ion channel [Alphaproteobacteria bacterium]
MEVELNGMMELGIMWGMRVLSAALIMIAGWVIGGWLRRRIVNIKKLDKTISSFLGGLAKYTVLAVAFVAVLGQFGVETASLLAVLGAAGLAIGLALQGTLSNVAAGTMLLILRPFKVGDYIEFGSVGGTVSTLGLFGTELNTVDNKYVFAPNSSIWGTEITNYSRNKQRRQDIIVGISYNDDIDKAFKTIQKVLKKEKRLIKTAGKEPIIVVGAMGASSVDLTVRIWTKTEDFFGVQWDLTKAIKEQLDKDGISIPFPTRTLEIQNPTALISSKAA